jgi:hypothetical protein
MRSGLARLARFYSEREICDSVWPVASEHFYDPTSIGLDIGSDGLYELSPQRATTALQASSRAA